MMDEDSNLIVQVAALRRALRAATGSEHWIETQPRRGYRFVGRPIRHEPHARNGVLKKGTGTMPERV